MNVIKLTKNDNRIVILNVNNLIDVVSKSVRDIDESYQTVVHMRESHFITVKETADEIYQMLQPILFIPRSSDHRFEI